MIGLMRLWCSAVAVLLLSAGSAAATNPAPTAGGWQPWVLNSGDQFRLPPPPDAAATRAELERLRPLVTAADPETRSRITWWGAVAPSYRWNRIALDAALAANLPANIAARHLALLHTTLADAMIAAWDSKSAHGRPRPASVDPTLRTALPNPADPSYPDEHAVGAAVAATILTELFPQRAATFAALAEEAGRMRMLAGLAFPSDVVAGTTLGRQVAAVALERARSDGFARPWTGSVPTGPGLWNGTNPILPQAGTWRPWLLTAPDEFRPPPPPAYDSLARAAEMSALRAFPRTPKTNADALFWEYAVGGLRNYDYWTGQLSRLLLEYGMAADAPRAARAYALFEAAFADAGIACWDGKYAYWTIRPFQLDPTFRTVFPTPNHPSYPAAHTCFGETSALVLGHLFPGDAAALAALGREAGDSRIWAGIHYQSDVDASREIARRVAGRVIERARADGADR